ncbi:hypothetical protein ABVT39_014880 [Epinephelus coioides]
MFRCRSFSLRLTSRLSVVQTLTAAPALRKCRLWTGMGLQGQDRSTGTKTKPPRSMDRNNDCWRQRSDNRNLAGLFNGADVTSLQRIDKLPLMIIQLPLLS